jgi:hypothetical protein
MSEGKCPNCGADEDWYDMAVRHWSCGSSRNENMKYLSESGECLRRQLAQRDRRIRVLEEQNGALVAAVLQVEAKNADLQARIDAVAAKCVGRMVELLAD